MMRRRKLSPITPSKLPPIKGRHKSADNDQDLLKIRACLDSLETEFDFSMSLIDREIKFNSTRKSRLRSKETVKVEIEETPFFSTEPSPRIRRVIPRPKVEKLDFTLFEEVAKPSNKKGLTAIEISNQLNISVLKTGDLCKKVKRTRKIFKKFRHYKPKRYNEERDELPPEEIYAMTCSEKDTLPLPLLSHIQDKKLALNRYNINPQICEALEQSLPNMTYLRFLELNNCDISDLGGSLILEGLIHQQVFESLSYTYNEIGPIFADKFDTLIKNTQFSYLDISGCKSVGNGINTVLSHIVEDDFCKCLKLREVGLNSEGMENLRKIVRRRKIVDLDLSWNNIASYDSYLFFTDLKKHRRLRYLDYSWNRLSYENNQISMLIAQFLHSSTSIMHLNLSYTHLNDTDLQNITQKVNDSNSMVGLHLTGNNFSEEGIVSFKNALAASIEIEEPPILNPLENLLPNTMRMQQTSKLLKTRYYRDKEFYFSEYYKNLVVSRVLGKEHFSNAWHISNHCWVCQKWNFLELEISRDNLTEVPWGSSFDFTNAIISSHNNWKPLSLSEKADNLFLPMLLPPGTHKFWVVYNNKPCIVNTEPQSYLGDFAVNELEVEFRLELPLSLKNTTPKVRPPRVFVKEKSVFKTFQTDNAATVAKMFEADSSHFKFKNLVKNAQSRGELLNYLLSQYSQIKEIFDYLAAISNFPSISWLDFSHFCEQCQIVDNKYIHFSDIDRIFIAVNYDQDSLDANPERELCRYEFFEIIVRIAMCKYAHLMLTPLESTKKLLVEHLYPYGPSSASQETRYSNIYTLEVADLLQANLMNLQKIFNMYREHPRVWVSFNKIKEFAIKSRFQLAEREIVKCYAFSKMSIIDEMANIQKYFKIFFVEFLELVCRFSMIIETGKPHEQLEKCLKKIFEYNSMNFKLPTNEDEDSDDDLEDETT